VVGFLGTEDDIEISLWRPYFSRRVEDVRLTDSPQSIRDRGVKYVVVGGFNLSQNHVPLDDWLSRSRGDLIATTSATLKVSEGPQPWYIVRLRD
jgi:hypothetical protein